MAFTSLAVCTKAISLRPRFSNSFEGLFTIKVYNEKVWLKGLPDTEPQAMYLSKKRFRMELFYSSLLLMNKFELVPNAFR